MSLDEYNRHAMLGPLAGPATTASSIAGRAAYDRTHQNVIRTDGAPAPEFSLTASLKVLIFMVLLAGASALAVVLLPEKSTWAAVVGFVAMTAGIGVVILLLFVGIELLKHLAAFILIGAGWLGLWWAAGAAAVAWVFAEVHELAFFPVPSWVAASVAAALVVAGRFVPALRLAAVATAAGVIAYAIGAEYVFESRLTAAGLTGLPAAAVVAAGGWAWRQWRHRRRSFG